MEEYVVAGITIRYCMSEKNPKARLPVCGDDGFEAMRRQSCTTNAIANITGDDFTKIFKRQLSLAEENLCLYNNPAIINTIMREDYWYDYHDGTNCMSGWVFYLTHPTGKYLVGTQYHLYALIDGVIYDNYKTYYKEGEYILPTEIDKILCDSVVGYYSKVGEEDDTV